MSFAISTSGTTMAENPSRIIQSCGGMAYAHVGYERQLALKAEILSDAFRRIGRIALPTSPTVLALTPPRRPSRRRNSQASAPAET